MKKNVFVLLVLLSLLLTACAKAEPETAESAPISVLTLPAPTESYVVEKISHESEAIPSIDFRYLYRGFTPVRLDDREAFADFTGFGTKIILNEEDWSAFMGSYCPGIPYYEPWDFSGDYLIASIVQGARPTYTSSNLITGLSWSDGCFLFEYENDPTGYIYALNDGDTVHFYVEVLIASREDLPGDIEDMIYHT